jgi:crotonyl-CoA carboxylase/reductase
VRQKRLQGSHGTNDEQARAYNNLVAAGTIDPCLGKLYRFEEIPDAHDEMERGVDVFGNRVALVGAARPGLGRRS